MKLFGIFALIVIILLLGCSESSDSSNLTGTSNHTPVIQTVTATPTTAWQHESWGPLLQCVALDEDGDSLKYYWNCQSGYLDGQEDLRASVRYYAWSTPLGDIWIQVRVSDGRDTDIDSVKVTVISG